MRHELGNRVSTKLASPAAPRTGKPHLQLAELLAGLQGPPVQVAPAVAQVADIIHLLLGQLHLRASYRKSGNQGVHLPCSIQSSCVLSNTVHCRMSA